MINSDDPRLTAYALGELDDGERSEVEAALAASPELQAEVASIRQTAALFGDSLQAEPGPTLTDAQRLAVQQQSSVGSVELSDRSTVAKKSVWRRAIILFAATGIAASILIAFLLPAVQSAREATRRVAHSPAEPWYGVEDGYESDGPIEVDEVQMSKEGTVELFSEVLGQPLDDTDYADAYGGESMSREDLFLAPSDRNDHRWGERI